MEQYIERVDLKENKYKLKGDTSNIWNAINTSPVIQDIYNRLSNILEIDFEKLIISIEKLKDLEKYKSEIDALKKEIELLRLSIPESSVSHLYIYKLSAAGTPNRPTNDEVYVPEGWLSVPPVEIPEGYCLYLSYARKLEGSYIKWDDGFVWTYPIKCGGASNESSPDIDDIIDQLNIEGNITLYRVGYISEIITEEARKKATIPAGWSEYPSVITEEDGDKVLCMITGKTKNGQLVSYNDYYWSEPISLGNGTTSSTGVDTDEYHYIYTTTREECTIPKPTFSVEDISETGTITVDGITWTESPQGITSLIKCEYVSVFHNDTWTEPVLWARYGEKGIDGDGVEYVFCLLKTIVSEPTNMISYNDEDENWNDDDYLPSNPQLTIGIYKDASSTEKEKMSWKDNPQNITETYPYQYVSIRKKSCNIWGPFSKPALWSSKGQNGSNAVGYEFTINTQIVNKVNITQTSTILVTAYKYNGILQSTSGLSIKTDLLGTFELNATTKSCYIPIAQFKNSTKSILNLTLYDGAVPVMTKLVLFIEPTQGIQGSVLRYLGDWEEITKDNPHQFLCNTVDSDGISYIDVITYNDTYYLCKLTHTGSNEVTPNNDITHWEQADLFNFIITKSLIAKSINSETITAKDVVIRNGNGKIVAGMTATNVHDVATEETNIDSVRIWGGRGYDDTGKLNIQKAPFRVYEDGHLVATQATIKGTIEADRGSFRGEVKATSLQVVNNDITVIEFTTWTADMQRADLNAPEIVVGTPVLKAYNNITDKYYYAPMYALGAEAVLGNVIIWHNIDPQNLTQDLTPLYISMLQPETLSKIRVCYCRRPNGAKLADNTEMASDTYYQQVSKADGGFEYTKVNPGNYIVADYYIRHLGNIYSRDILTWELLFGLEGWVLDTTYSLGTTPEGEDPELWDVTLYNSSDNTIIDKDDETLTDILNGNIYVVAYRYLTMDSNGKCKVKHLLNCTFGENSAYCRRRESEGDPWSED